VNEDIPCRVSADLARYEREQRDAEQIRFDEYDDALFQDICGERLAKPVQELLLSLHHIEMVQESFGEPDKAKAFDRLLVELKWLREGMKDAVSDL
jgi:hypothetical protein